MAQTDEVQETVEEGAEKVSGGADGGGSLGKRILIPAAAGLGTLAATVAARKAPDLKDKLMGKIEKEGGEEAAEMGKHAASKLQGEGGLLGGLAGKATEKLSGGGSGGKEKTRRLPIQRWTDVAVPVDVAYAKWTEFEEFPKFMHRVLNVERKDDNLISWQEKIWFSTRQWEGEITEESKNERIAWKTTQGTAHAGVVSFHRLDKNLTRVMVTMDFRPSGMMEKMASGLRFVKRAVQADLARFKAYVEMDETEGIEYKSVPAGSDSDEDESKESEEQPQASQNGRGDSDEAQERSSEETEKAREERAQRRKQRRS
jgi:uncharacterized membrane protein